MAPRSAEPAIRPARYRWLESASRSDAWIVGQNSRCDEELARAPARTVADEPGILGPRAPSTTAAGWRVEHTLRAGDDQPTLHATGPMAQSWTGPSGLIIQTWAQDPCSARVLVVGRRRHDPLAQIVSVDMAAGDTRTEVEDVERVGGLGWCEGAGVAVVRRRGVWAWWGTGRTPAQALLADMIDPRGSWSSSGRRAFVRDTVDGATVVLDLVGDGATELGAGWVCAAWSDTDEVVLVHQDGSVHAVRDDGRRSRVAEPVPTTTPDRSVGRPADTVVGVAMSGSTVLLHRSGVLGDELRACTTPAGPHRLVSRAAALTLGRAVNGIVPVVLDDPRHGRQERLVTGGEQAVGAVYAAEVLVAESSDGAHVPVSLVGRGVGPVLALVYGGFGMPLRLGADPLLTGWLNHGGRCAVIHVRGSGGWGPGWAAAGRRAGKDLAVDDLVAGMRLLAADDGRVVLSGASNGGLLAAAAVAREPTCTRALLVVNPLADTLRYTAVGVPQRWVDEYGDPADPDDRATLQRWSPVDTVADGAKLPPTLIVTGDRDRVVPAWHGWKLAASWQDAAADPRSILLRHHDGGHDGLDAGDAATESWSALNFLLRAVGG